MLKILKSLAFILPALATLQISLAMLGAYLNYPRWIGDIMGLVMLSAIIPCFMLMAIGFNVSHTFVNEDSEEEKRCPECGPPKPSTRATHEKKGLPI